MPEKNNSSRDLGRGSLLKDSLAVVILGFSFVAIPGYYSCIREQGGISGANNYISRMFHEGMSTLNNAPWHACNP